MLSGQENRAVSSKSLLERAHGPLPAYLESNFCEGENDDVANRNHRVPGDVGRSTI
jgi:hypothetical protein